jgi:hypothetical protein
MKRPGVSRWKVMATSTIVFGALSGGVLGTQPAHADQVSGEGSLSDTQNAVNAANSDSTSGAGDLAELAPTVSSIVATQSGCGGYYTKPALVADEGSYTDESITAELYLQCSGFNYIDLHFYIQRSRWYGWENLTSQHISGEKGPNYGADLTPSTSCRAGTWSYRSEVTGGWDGSYDGETHSSSFRHTCVKQTDINYVDQG